MKRLCTTVLSILIGLCVTPASYGQNAAANPVDVSRCVGWVQKTVPVALQVVASDFCRGIKSPGSPDGWYSIKNCGAPANIEKAQGRMFCSSSGVIGPDTTIAAGYSALGTDGGELLSSTVEGGTKPTATLYSRTPLHIADAAVPAGFSQLTFSRTDRGWQMTIKPEGETSGFTVPLMSDTRQLSAVGSELAIAVHFTSHRCADFLHTRELVFTYGGADLSVCIHPDPIPPASGESIATR